MKLIEKMFDDNEKEEVERIPRKADITKRELDIVRLIAQEMTNLLRKLGVKNTAGLVKYAVMNGLLES